MQGRYVLGRPLGLPGGFGITYHAWDSGLQRRVAIKEFFPRHVAHRDGDRSVSPADSLLLDEFRAELRGFLEEAQRAARIQHDNVVRILDFMEAFNTGYIVMPYYDGETLAARRMRSPKQCIPWQEAIPLVMPILSALEAIHAAGMIHRDVKPANIYLAREASDAIRPILLDFGAARVTTTARQLTGILSQGYAPLEQYDLTGGPTQGAWTDVYAAAATLHELLTGQQPPSAPSRQIGRTLVDVRAVQPDVPDRVVAALDRALRLAPNERTASARQLAEQLDPKQPVNARKAPGSRKVRLSRRAVAAATMIFGATLTGISAWVLKEPPPSKPPVTRSPASAPPIENPPPVVSTRAQESVETKRAVRKPSVAPNEHAATVQPSAERQRARGLLEAGDYRAAWDAALQGGDHAFAKQIRDACRTDSLLSARRGVSVECPIAR